MKIRAQMSMLFHLDKCIGCHTCSIACKNLWTDRKGAEYMWWNNVETRPGVGYPTLWENQQNHRGGWAYKDGKLTLRLQSQTASLFKLFYNPAMPTIDEYYEPFTFRYQDLFTAQEGDDQPTAIPISKLTGKPIEIKSGPNWDDDLGGSPIYARNDPCLEGLNEEVRQQLNTLEQVVFTYLPRICNHCLNPACVAACPSGAIYKRGEDGIVLLNENKCRAWRMCESGCPYKKVYFNWATGKSEKCILCFPRLETGQVTACAHSCVGRIRFMGLLLYDAERIPEAVKVPDEELIAAQRAMILDPFDPLVIAEAKASGIEDDWIISAQRSPAYKLFKEWQIALPIHPEYRTMAMIFYVPPLSPVLGSIEKEIFRLELSNEIQDFEQFQSLDAARLPVKYLANLFAAGNEEVIRVILQKLIAVRLYMRHKNVDGHIDPATMKTLEEVGLTCETAEGLYRLTTVASKEERFVLPQYHRETTIESSGDPMSQRGSTGFGYLMPPRRGE